MSPRQRAVTISADTKAKMVHVANQYGTEFYSEFIKPCPLDTMPGQFHKRPRHAIIEGDPVDISLDWQTHNRKLKEMAGTTVPVKNILLLNPASEATPGGDWLNGSLGPEESLARRSTLVHTLSNPIDGSPSHYPLPLHAAIYSESVVVFREGPGPRDFTEWRQEDWDQLSVVSVAPVKRPRLDSEGRYAFPMERDAQREKMKNVLRVAYEKGHRDLCLGAFGATVSNGTYSTGNSAASDCVYGGAGRFRNPLKEVVLMWKDLLFEDPEFKGKFDNIVFAIQPGTGEEWRRVFTYNIDVQ